MIIYAENQGFICALLEMDEQGIFARVQSECFHDLQPHEAEQTYLDTVSQALKKEGDAYWESLFFDLHTYEFVLLEEREGDLEHPYGIAGKTSVSLEYNEDKKEASAMFFNTHILSTYRGHGLSSLLYEARLNLLAENPLVSTANMMIEPWNIPSIRAAHNAGFQVFFSNPDMLVLERPLDSFGRNEADAQYKPENRDFPVIGL